MDARFLHWVGGTAVTGADRVTSSAYRGVSKLGVATGFHEVVVKTKNRYYDMRGTLDQLEFDVIKYEVHTDNRESKVYLSKQLTSAVVRKHTSTRTVVFAD